MKILNVLAIVFGLATSAFAVSVDFRDEQIHNESMLGMRLIVNKDSNEILRNIRIRYLFYKEKSKEVVVGRNYAAGANITIKMLCDTIGYVEISVDSISSKIFPDLGGLSLGLHYRDWTPLVKFRHPSYLNAHAFALNEKILVYKDDLLIFGNSQFAEINNLTHFKIVGIRPNENAWIDIQNVGEFDASMEKVSLVDGNGFEILLDSVFLKKNEILRVCRDSVACTSFQKKILVPSFSWGKAGEALLKRDSVWMSYLAWGKEGHYAATAVEYGIWTDAFDFLAKEYVDSVANVPVKKNVFYRDVSPSVGFDAKSWMAFSEKDNPDFVDVFPNPIKLSMNKPEVRRLVESDSAIFKWSSVQNASSYKLVVRDSLKNTLYEIETVNTQVALPLPDGIYSWKVYAGRQIDENGVVYTEKDGVIEYDFITTALVSQGVDIRMWKERPVEIIKARKDTRLLNLGYIHRLKEQGWDVFHVNSLQMDSLESRRCWAVAAEVMNHFYGGNLTQDEIVFRVQFKEDEPLLSPFINNGADSVRIDKALKFALNTDKVIRYEGIPSFQTVKREIDAGRLILAGIHEHALVIHGYAGDSANYGFLYAFGDNDGTTSNSAWTDSPIEFYYLMEELPTSVRMTDYRVHYDSDGDGIVDFDEEVRFKTDSFNADTDGDGIEDKREIYSYAYNPTGGTSNLIKLQRSSDKNKNGIRAELDPDDNGDGVLDGLKTLTENAQQLMDVPSGYTLFARDHLVLTDGVKCFNSVLENENFCKVASAGMSIFQYRENPDVVTLGARTHVGKVDAYLGGYSDGIVKMRSGATIYGNIHLFGKRPLANLGGRAYVFEDFLSRQQSSEIQGQIELKSVLDWNLDYLFRLPNLSEIVYSSKKVVTAGETFYFANGMAFDSLKVESGATIVFAPGEMFVQGLLQLEAGATIEYLNPGEKTVLNLNGKLKWQATSNKELDDVDYWERVARGFMLIQRKSETMYIEGNFAGTLYAPFSKIIMGQTKKIYYGRILARDITVHQYTKIFRVDFNPVEPLIYVFKR